MFEEHQRFRAMPDKGAVDCATWRISVCQGAADGAGRRRRRTRRIRSDPVAAVSGDSPPAEVVVGAGDRGESSLGWSGVARRRRGRWSLGLTSNSARRSCSNPRSAASTLEEGAVIG